MRALNPPADWVALWQQGDPPTDQEALVWLRTRPPPVRMLLRRFPPSCLVRGTRPLLCPAPGEVGIMTSYFEDGLLTVRAGPESDLRAACEPEWLEVVGYHRGMTTSWIEAILKGADGLL